MILKDLKGRGEGKLEEYFQRKTGKGLALGSNTFVIIEADFFSQWLSVVEVYQDLSVSQRGGSYSALGCRLIGNCILWQRTVEYTNRPLLWDDWEAVFALCTEA